MTTQQNPPRAREEIEDEIAQGLAGVGAKPTPAARAFAKGWYDEIRDGVLAELRAGAEPAIYQWKPASIWNDCTRERFFRAKQAGYDVRALYLDPPISREAELTAEVERLACALSDAHDMLTQPAWQKCASTHCERKQECRSPSECGGSGVPRAIRLLSAALATTQEGKSHD